MRLLVVLALAFAVGCASKAPPPTAGTAPPGASLRLASMRLHDPFIVADGGSRTYFLFTRNIPEATGDPREGTMLYTSRDLLKWTRPKVVFAVPQGMWASEGAWAPEVHRSKGKWYLFTTFHNEALKLPPTHMNLDGHLYVEGGKPWLVYAHEWLQTTDGTMEAVQLDDQLAAAGEPNLLFRASQAPWVKGQGQNPADRIYVSDGLWLHRSRTGNLLMLWSSYGEDGYNEAQARSRTGTLAGPWEQLPPLVGGSSGHGMLFHTLEGKLMMILHRPFGARARGKLREMRDAGDRLEIIRQRIDVDGG